MNMATKKKAVKKPEKKTVTVYIPFVEGEEDELTIGINGVMYKVKRGEEVEVPRAVAVVIRNSNLQAKLAKEYCESVKNVAIAE